ncbi:hypothetical protein DFH28DRAFT_1130623 [Melampsora americana]|nr:hypothetical protein DFH28DRAFT_1130623 [Melampsora americana]
MSNEKVPKKISLDLSLKLGSGLDGPSTKGVEGFINNEKPTLEHKGDVLTSRIFPLELELDCQKSHSDSRNHMRYLDKGSIPKDTRNFFDFFPTVPEVFRTEILSHRHHWHPQEKATEALICEESPSILPYVMDSSPSYMGNSSPIGGVENQNIFSAYKHSICSFNSPVDSQTDSFERQKNPQHSAYHTHIGSTATQKSQKTPLSPSFEFDQRQDNQHSKSHKSMGSTSPQHNQGESMASNVLIKKLVRHGREITNADANTKHKLELWFQDLETEMKIKLGMIYDPKDKMFVSILQAVKIAKSKVAMGFIACLKFLYLESNQDLDGLIAEGWKYILKILEDWKTIDLGTIPQEAVTTLGSSAHYVDAHNLLDYLRSLKQRSNLSFQFYCNVHNTWITKATTKHAQNVKLIKRTEFVQRLQEALRSQDNTLEAHMRLLEPSISNPTCSQNAIKRDIFDVIESDHNVSPAQTKKPCQRKSIGYAKESLKQVRKAWKKMPKPSEHLALFSNWLNPLLEEIQGKYHENRSGSSFILNEPRVFKGVSKGLVSHFLTILVLLNTQYPEDNNHHVMIDGLNFLKYFLEHWRHAEVENIMKIQEMNYNKFSRNLTPSGLLRYAIQAPNSAGESLSTKILWGMWGAWFHWNGSKISNKTHIGSYSELLEELGKATSARQKRE